MFRNRMLVQAVLLLAAVILLAVAPAGAQSSYSATVLKSSSFTAPLCPGTLITYSIALTNTSSSATPPVSAHIRDIVPANVSYVAGSATNGATFDAGLNRIEWQGTLPPTIPTNRITISFQVTVNAGVRSGTTINNVATGSLHPTAAPAVEVQSSANDFVFCASTTGTFTVTPTRTATPTQTAFSTTTPTQTATPTPTRTRTPTRTSTPAPTGTPTSTPTPISTLSSPTATSSPTVNFPLFFPRVVDGSTKLTEGVNTLALDNGRLRVVMDKRWGGAIRELWFQGQNLVNNFDGGRLSGVSLYDEHTAPPSGDYADPAWGWNPTPSDIYDHANPPLSYSFEDGVLYVKARNVQWNPNNKGGGPTQAVASDILVETWIDLPPLAPNGVHVKYRVTHDGSDAHGRVEQELGYVYVRQAYRRFVRYTGNAPWTNAAVQIRETPPVWPAFGKSAATEHWGGFVDANDFGLIVWAPQAYPRLGYVFHDRPGPPDDSTAYMNPMTLMRHEPGASYEFEQVLFAGRWQDARAQIYTLRQHWDQIPDLLAGFGTIDLPIPNAAISGMVEVAGWAVDDRGIARVEVLLDGQVVGQAHYGLLREDVGDHYPGFPDLPQVGFSYLLDSTRHADGDHTLQVRAVDAAGNAAWLWPESLAVQVSNRSFVPTPRRVHYVHPVARP